MSKLEYPEGALRSMRELEALVESAKTGAPSKIYSYLADGEPVLMTMILDSRSHLKDEGSSRYLLFGHSPQKGKDKTSILATNRNLDCLRDDRGFILTNYWLAYAYMLRKQANDKP